MAFVVWPLADPEARFQNVCSSFVREAPDSDGEFPTSGKTRGGEGL